MSASNDIQQKDVTPVQPPIPVAADIAAEVDKVAAEDSKDSFVEIDAPKEPDTSVSVHIPQALDISETIESLEEAVTPAVLDIPTIEEPVVKIEEPVVKIDEPVLTIEESILKVQEPILRMEELELTAEEPVLEEPVIEQLQEAPTQIADSSTQSNAAVQADASKGATENNAASLFEQRQRQYLSGRRATKTIADNAGNVLINEGMLISDEAIDAAKLSGKLIELIMNNKA